MSNGIGSRDKDFTIGMNDSYVKLTIVTSKTLNDSLTVGGSTHPRHVRAPQIAKMTERERSRAEATMNQIAHQHQST